MNTGRDEPPVMQTTGPTPDALPQPSDTRPVTQADLDDILNDPALQPHERRARLEALAASHGDSALVERGSQDDLFGIQISEALGLLAEGGHDYRPSQDAKLNDTDGS